MYIFRQNQIKKKKIQLDRQTDRHAGRQKYRQIDNILRDKHIKLEKQTKNGIYRHKKDRRSDTYIVDRQTDSLIDEFKIDKR